MGRTHHISRVLRDLAWSLSQYLVWSHSTDPKAFKAGVMGVIGEGQRRRGSWGTYHRLAWVGVELGLRILAHITEDV